MQKRSRVRGNNSGWPVEDSVALYGITFHPKTKTAVVVGGYNNRLFVFDEKLNHVTGGWYQQYYDSSYSQSEETGYPRAHVGTESSRPLGAGWGSALYNGLCIGARVRDLGARLPDMRIKGSGISSTEATRSSSANRWWASAVKAGFAYETEITVTVETDPEEESFEITPERYGRGQRYYDAIVEAINNYLENVQEIYGADWSMPEISGTYEVGGGEEEHEITANVLPFEPENGASGISKLVLCTFKNAPLITRDGFSDLSWLTEDEVSDFEPDVLRVLNLKEASPEVLGLIRRVAEVMDASDVLEGNETLPRLDLAHRMRQAAEGMRNRRRSNGDSAERQAAERRMRLDAWANLED